MILKKDNSWIFLIIGIVCVLYVLYSYFNTSAPPQIDNSNISVPSTTYEPLFANYTPEYTDNYTLEYTAKCSETKEKVSESSPVSPKPTQNYFDVNKQDNGFLFEPKPIELKPLSNVKIVNGISNILKPIDNFTNTNINTETKNASIYNSDLFQKTVMNKKFADFNPNFTNIMSMVPDMYKQNNAPNKSNPKYKPIELNDLESATFNKDIIDLKEGRVMDIIYKEIANDTDDQRKVGGYT